jgi:hypothetical protein
MVENTVQGCLAFLSTDSNVESEKKERKLADARTYVTETINSKTERQQHPKIFGPS